MVERINSNSLTAQNTPVDRGLQYGDGLFETIAVEEQKPVWLTEHLNRLQHGCKKLKIPVPNLTTVKLEIEQLASQTDESTCGRGVVKIIITRGVGGRGYQPSPRPKISQMINLYPWPEHITSWQTSGINLHYCTTRLACNPTLAGIKHLNRLEQVLASLERADLKNIDEGVMLNLNDEVIEGTMSNIFAIIDKNLITPDLTMCGVAGIMRSKVISVAKTLNIPVQVQPLRATDLTKASELFITNSIIGIVPVKRIGEKLFDGDSQKTSILIAKKLYNNRFLA